MLSLVMKRGIPWQLADAGILDQVHRHAALFYDQFIVW
jgi:hypothetical protein